MKVEDLKSLSAKIVALERETKSREFVPTVFEGHRLGDRRRHRLSRSRPCPWLAVLAHLLGPGPPAGDFHPMNPCPCRAYTRRWSGARCAPERDLPCQTVSEAESADILTEPS